VGGATAPLGAAVVQNGSSVTAAVLPAATARNLDSTQDAMTMIYAVMAAMERSQTQRAQVDVDQAKLGRMLAIRERDEALARAREESEKGGFFKWLSKDLGLGGVVGLATFNYAVVAADLAAHKTGVVHNLKLDVVDAAAVAAQSPEVLAADVLLRKTDATPEAIRQKLDDMGIGSSAPGISDEDVKPIVGRAIQINLLVAGTAASILTAGSTGALVVAIVGAALSVSGTAVQMAGGSGDLALGLQIAGAVCSMTAGFVPPQGAGAAAGAKIAARAAVAVTNGAKGADRLMTAVHEHAADNASIDAEAALHTLQKLGRLLDGLVDSVKEIHESHKRAADTVLGALQTHNETLVAASCLRG
jgi:hypothetical protein